MSEAWASVVDLKVQKRVAGTLNDLRAAGEMLRSHWATVGSGMLIVTVPVPLNAPAGISTFHGPTCTVPPTSPLMMPVARSGKPVTPAGWSQDVLAGSRLTREGCGGRRPAVRSRSLNGLAAEASRGRS